jgi:putative copper export protein
MLEPLLAFVAMSPVPSVEYGLPPAWRYLTKFTYFAGLAMVIGTTVVHSLVLRPALKAHGADPRDREILRRRSAIALAVAGLFFLAALYPQLAGKVARAGDGMPFGQALEPGNVWAYLVEPAPVGIPLGVMVLVQFGTYAVSALLLLSLVLPAMRRHVNGLAASAAIGTALASVMLSVSGDLIARDIDGWMSRIPSYVHVLSGTTWVGSIAALAVIGTAHRQLSPDAGIVWAHMWKRFSRIAQLCVAGIIVSGLWMVWHVVSSPAELFTTTFGQLLLLKILLVIALLVIGCVNEYVLMPRIARLRAEGDRRGLFALAARHFPRTVAVEALIGLGVLIVLPFLNGSARAEAGVPEPLVTARMFVATAGLLVIVVASLAVNVRLQAAAERRAMDTNPGRQDQVDAMER